MSHETEPRWYVTLTDIGGVSYYKLPLWISRILNNFAPSCQGGKESNMATEYQASPAEPYKEIARLRAEVARLTVERDTIRAAHEEVKGYLENLTNAQADAEARAQSAEAERDALGESLRREAHYKAIAEQQADAAEAERDAAEAREKDLAQELQRIGMTLGSTDEWSDHKNMIADVGRRFDGSQAALAELREAARRFVNTRSPLSEVQAAFDSLRALIEKENGDAVDGV